MGAAPQGGLGTFYIDASVPRQVREVIASMRDDVLYAGGPDAPPESEDDQVWLRRAGEEDWVVILRDKKIRKKPREREALLGSGVRSFCMTSGGNYTKWETLRLMAYRWPGIEERASKEAGPYIYGMTWAGFRKLFIPGQDA
jgi:hypothetical protein